MEMNDSLLQQILAEQQRMANMQQQQQQMIQQQQDYAKMTVPEDPVKITAESVPPPEPPPIQNNYTALSPSMPPPVVQVGVAPTSVPAPPVVQTTAPSAPPATNPLATIGGTLFGGITGASLTPPNASAATTRPIAPPTQDVMNMALNDMISTRTYRMGAEAQQDYYSDQRAQVQMGIMSAGESALNIGATAGTFLMPGGLIAGLAAGSVVSAGVGLVAGSMMDGAKTSLAYQDVLREKGYKAFNVFESQNDFGGVGLNLDDQQDLSKFLREEAPANFLEDEEIQKILSGALDGKLMKSSTDMDSFKKKFKEIVGVVKEMTVSMNASIEEVTAMMGELERRGVKVNQMGNVGAMAKLTGSFLGVGTQQAFEQMLEQSDRLTQGTSLDAGEAMKAAAANTFVTTQLTEQYADATPEMKSYIKNNGGEAGVAADMTQRIATAMSSTPEIQDMSMTIAALGLEKDEEGNLKFDQNKVNEMLASGGNAQEKIAQGTKALQSLDSADLVNYQQSFSEMSRSELNQSQQAQMTQLSIKAFQDMTGANEETAAMRLGLASNQKDATVFMDQLNNLADPNTARMFDAMAFREQMNATKIAESPTFFQRMKYGFREFVTEPIGNLGQGISDEIGDVSLDLQKFMSGVGDRTFTRSNNLVDPNDLNAFQKQFNVDEKGSATNRLYEGIVDSSATDYNKNYKNALKDSLDVKFDATGATRITGERFEKLVDQYEDRKLDASAIAGLREEVDAGKMDKMSESRAKYIIDLAAGKNMAETGTASNSRGYADYETLAETTNAEKKEFGELGDQGTIAGILDQQEKTQKKIKEDAGKYDKNLQDALNKSDLSRDDTVAVQRAIRTKDYDAVAEITKDKGILKAVDKLEGLNKRTEAFTEAAGGLKDVTAQIELTASLPEYYEKMLVSSGALSKEEAGSLFGDLNSDAKKLKKDLKGKDISIDEAIKTAKGQQEDGKTLVATLGEEQLTKLAQSVVDSSSADEIASLKDLSTGGSIDASKVASAIDAVAVASSKDADGAVNKDKKIGDALDDHSDAMSKMLETLTKEAKNMKDAKKAIVYGNTWTSRM